MRNEIGNTSFRPGKDMYAKQQITHALVKEVKCVFDALYMYITTYRTYIDPRNPYCLMSS